MRELCHLLSPNCKWIPFQFIPKPFGASLPIEPPSKAILSGLNRSPIPVDSVSLFPLERVQSTTQKGCSLTLSLSLMASGLLSCRKRFGCALWGFHLFFSLEPLALLLQGWPHPNRVLVLCRKTFKNGFLASPVVSHVFASSHTISFYTSCLYK